MTEFLLFSRRVLRFAYACLKGMMPSVWKPYTGSAIKKLRGTGAVSWFFDTSVPPQEVCSTSWNNCCYQCYLCAFANGCTTENARLYWLLIIVIQLILHGTRNVRDFKVYLPAYFVMYILRSSRHKQWSLMSQQDN